MSRVCTYLSKGEGMLADDWIERESEKREFSIQGYSLNECKKIAFCLVLLMIGISIFLYRICTSFRHLQILVILIFYIAVCFLLVMAATLLSRYVMLSLKKFSNKYHDLIASFCWALLPVVSTVAYLFLWHITPCILSLIWPDSGDFSELMVPSAVVACVMVLILTHASETSLKKQPRLDAMRVVFASGFTLVIQADNDFGPICFPMLFSEWVKAFLFVVSWSGVIVTVILAVRSYKSINKSEALKDSKK